MDVFLFEGALFGVGVGVKGKPSLLFGGSPIPRTQVSLAARPGLESSDEVPGLVAEERHQEGRGAPGGGVLKVSDPKGKGGQGFVWEKYGRMYEP